MRTRSAFNQPLKESKAEVTTYTKKPITTN